MSKFSFLTILLLVSVRSYSQGFCELGGSEKVWVLLHPFSAKKAKIISQRAIEITDSVSKTKTWLKVNAGGRKDCFRHGIWMSMMSSEIGPKRAIWLGKAHEKKNIADFKKNRLEEGRIPDQISIEMDLYNNNIGVKLGMQNSDEIDSIIFAVLNSIENGEFKMILMDKSGNSLDSSKRIIPRDIWEGKWENNRQLVNSY